MENLIGTVLHFEEEYYNRNIRAYNPLIKAVDEVAVAYKDLDSTFVFTQDIFNDILANQTRNITKQYEAIVDRQIEASGFTSKAIVKKLKDTVPIDLQPLTQKVQALFEALSKAEVENSGNLYNADVHLSLISIVNQKAVLTEKTKEEIKKHWQVKIETEAQNTLYNLSLQLKEDFHKIVAFLKGTGANLKGRPIIDNNGGLFWCTKYDIHLAKDLVKII